MADVTDTYYAGEAINGYGAQLLVGQGGASPETYAAVADVNEITFGEMTTNIIDITHLRSPDAHTEKMAGMRSSGEFGITGNWRPAHGSQSNAGGDGFTNGGLAALWRTRTEANFKLVLNDGSSPGLEIPFRGVVSRWQPGTVGVDAKVDFSAGITPLRDFSADLP
jgi:hypothetical protein